MRRRGFNFPKFIFSIVILGVVYTTGYFVGNRNFISQKSTTSQVTTASGQPANLDFTLFWDVWKLVREKYVGEADDQKLFYGAISGMVDALDDPYSLFLEPSENKRFLEDLKGEFEGIGAEISSKEGKLIIVAPLEDSPAEKAGLKPGDQIIKIDGKETEKMSLNEGIERIRGKGGTTVTLTIFREGFSELKDFVITRDKIIVKSVKWEIKENNIAYIKINQFGNDTVRLMKNTADEILKKNAKGVILDLRNNPGGFLDAAVDVTSLFISDNVVVEEQYKDGRKDTFRTTLLPKLEKLPLTILVNKGSASASEIVAGAVQDLERGKIIGEKTFGKGSVQDLENLKNDAALRITIAKWLTPKGKTINGEGILPDIQIKLTEEDEKAGRDPQMEKAVELLKSE